MVLIFPSFLVLCMMCHPQSFKCIIISISILTPCPWGGTYYDTMGGIPTDVAHTDIIFWRTARPLKKPMQIGLTCWCRKFALSTMVLFYLFINLLTLWWLHKTFVIKDSITRLTWSYLCTTFIEFVKTFLFLLLFLSLL